jgi:arginine/lysine/histidine transporter system substrate-binding protein
VKKRIVAFLIITMLIGILVACGTTNDVSTNNSDGGKKELVMATSADFPPFEYVDTVKSEEIIGFDVDLVNKIGKKLNYEIKVKDMDFNGLIPALQANKVDFVMSGMAPTPERKKNVDFTDSYYTSNLLMVVDKKSKIKSFKDIKGKKVGVQVGSIQEAKAKELQKTVKFHLENRDRLPDLVQELSSGRMNAVIMEGVVSKGYLKTNKNLRTISIPNGETSGTAIAFPKGSKLTKKFNAELDKMKENGELDKLIVKWFGGQKSNE